MSYRVLTSTLLAAALLLSPSACGPRVPLSYKTLANTGMLSLSSRNAFLGSNLFLAEEAMKSPHLYNFLAARGGPSALEIRQGATRSPELRLYYGREKEMFIGEPFETEHEYQWIIRGPYALDRESYRNLSRLESVRGGEPVFMIRGREKRFREEIPEVVAEPLKAYIPPVPTATPVPKKKAPPLPRIHPTATPFGGGDFRPLTVDQQALNIAKGYAERAENGDLIHVVKGENETLAKIAKWYTGSESNAAEIATLNGVQASAAVPYGMRVRVPLAKLSRLKAMPLDFK